MKRAAVAVPLLSLLIAACTAAAGTKVDVAAEEAAVRKMSDELLAAENAKDVEKAITYYTADAHFAPANEPAVHGTAALKDAYNRYFGMGLGNINSTVDHVEVAASGDLAYTYGKNTYTMNMPDGSAMNGVGKYVSVMKKVDGAWKVALLAISDDAPPPAAPPATTTAQ